MAKKPNAIYYTHGKLGRRFRYEDTDNPYLYSKRQYATKITEADLPKYYCPIKWGRSFGYADGFVKCAGVTDIAYRYVKENHIFKDDSLYLKYGGKLMWEDSRYGGKRCTNADITICDSEIMDILYYVEHYSSEVDTTEVRKLIKEKIQYLHDFEFDYYKQCFSTEELIDVFEYYPTPTFET